MKRLFYFGLFTLVVLLTVSLFTDVQAQCAMCRATVESNVEAQESTVGAGLNSGILYLMTIPYILIGTFGFIWYRYNLKKVNG